MKAGVNTSAALCRSNNNNNDGQSRFLSSGLKLAASCLAEIAFWPNLGAARVAFRAATIPFVDFPLQAGQSPHGETIMDENYHQSSLFNI